MRALDPPMAVVVLLLAVVYVYSAWKAWTATDERGYGHSVRGLISFALLLGIAIWHHVETAHASQ